MRKGFTLIEILVVVAISAMVSVIALSYTTIARNQVALSVETAKVAQSILRAKNLAVATYNTSPGTCGYGVTINIPGNTYSIFAYDPATSTYGPIPPCPSIASTTAAGVTSTEEVFYPDLQSAWQVSLANGVYLKSGGANADLVTVIFYPPAPTTLLSGDGATLNPPATASALNVYLSTVDGSANSVITVNPAGQVTF